MNSAAEILKTDSLNLGKRIEHLQNSIKALEADKKQLQQLIASGGGSNDLESKVVNIAEVDLLATILPGADKDLLRETIDQFKDKHANGIIVLGAEVDGKVKLVAGVSKSISKQYPAGKLIQHITSLADGRGGGRPDICLLYTSPSPRD